MSSVDLQGKTVCVLDTHGILYQVFHTMGDMSSPQGEPTGAVFGFVRDLISLLMKHRMDYLFCAFDEPGPTFRHDLYEPYKANRQAMPDDLRPQISFTHDFIEAFGISSLGLEKYEADDILATTARLTSEAGGRCILVTADKDARQLITDRVSLFNLRKQVLYTDKELLADWGIRPDQVVDFQTMVGDSTDNVPGIPLIGPKTATQLLQEYGTLENIFAHLDALKGKKKENIAASQESSLITRQLVKLRDDVPIEIDWESGRFRGIDRRRLQVLFQYFGFRTFGAKADELAQMFGRIELPEDENFNAKYRADRTNQSSLLNPPNATSSTEPELRQGTLFDTEENSNGSVEAIAANAKWAIGTDQLIGIKGSIGTAGTDEAIENSSAEVSNFFDDPAVKESFFAKLGSENIGLANLLSSDFQKNFTDKGFTGRYPESVEYLLVDTQEKYEAFLTDLKRQEIFCIDLETSDTRPRYAELVGIAICFELGKAFYLPVRGPLGFETLNAEQVLADLKPVLEDSTIRKIGQNIKYDLIVLRGYGINPAGVAFDTMVADYLLNAGTRLHNMDDMADRYFGYETVKISELIGTGKKQRKMYEVPTDLVSRYAGEDAHVTWCLFAALYPLLVRKPELLRLFIQLELPLIQVLIEMEYRGISVDPLQFKRLSLDFQSQLESLEGELRQIVANCDSDETFVANFNLNSNQQIQRVLFDDLKLPSSKKTKTGKSTDIEVLEELAWQHPFPQKLIEYRQLTKLKGTYLDPLPLLRHPETGRIHTSFNQVVTATGRLSSSDPNLQNIPVRNESGKQIRTGFVPDTSSGYDILLSCDYSQIELRMLAHFSKDEHLCAAFKEEVDIHSHVAANIFDVPISMVTSDMRRKAKAVNFGLIYGQSSFGLGKSLNISREEASEYINTFFKTYPGINIFLESVLADCRKKGYVSTILGRKRRVEGVRPTVKGSLNMPERIAINTVIQGSAADLMKVAMVRVWKRLYGEEKIAPEKAAVLLQIHDELVFETTTDFLPELTALVTEEMELGQPLAVPLKVDAETGRAWGDMK